MQAAHRDENPLSRSRATYTISYHRLRARPGKMKIALALEYTSYMYIAIRQLQSLPLSALIKFRQTRLSPRFYQRAPVTRGAKSTRLKIYSLSIPTYKYTYTTFSLSRHDRGARAHREKEIQFSYTAAEKHTPFLSFARAREWNPFAPSEALIGIYISREPPPPPQFGNPRASGRRVRSRFLPIGRFFLSLSCLGQRPRLESIYIRSERNTREEAFCGVLGFTIFRPEEEEEVAFFVARPRLVYRNVCSVIDGVDKKYTARGISVCARNWRFREKKRG